MFFFFLGLTKDLAWLEIQASYWNLLKQPLCHVNTSHWIQWRGGLCVSVFSLCFFEKYNFSAACLTFWHQSFTFNSNKSPTWCNNFSVYYPDVCLQLNMFRAFSRLSSGAQWLQWQPLVLPSYRGDSRAVFVVGPASPTTNTSRLSPRYEDKTRGCHCSHWAPDDGRENARNMLSCKHTSGW
jgi:hypothetical protein